MHELKSLPFDFLNHNAENGLLFFFLFWEENNSCSIFSFLRHWYSLEQYEFMWNLNHDSSPIAVLSHFRASVSHVFEHLERIIHKFMTFIALDVDHHANSTSIMLITFLVKSL